MKELGISPITLYTKMKISKQSYYYYIGKPTIDTGMLLRFCEGVGYNFFKEYVLDLDEKEMQIQLLAKRLNSCESELASTKDKLLVQYERGYKNGENRNEKLMGMKNGDT